MELDPGRPQHVHGGDGRAHVGKSLAGDADDQVNDHINGARTQFAEGLGELFVGMVAVQQSQALGMDGLQAELDAEIDAPIHLLQQGQDRAGEGVGSGADEQPDDLLIIEDGLVLAPQLRDGPIGIAVRLEISDEFLAGMAPDMGVDLPFDGPGRRGDGAGSVAIAENAAGSGERPVAIGAGEPRIDGDLLHPCGRGIWILKKR